MSHENPGKLTIWGRPNSVNVQKVLWCLRELELPFARIDAGMQFGRNDEPDYLAMNPNGRIPTLVDGDYVLWESNSIMRYLCMAYGKASQIYPQDAQHRAGVDRWLDWTLSTLQPVDRPVFWALVRTPVAQRDMSAIQKDADAAAGGLENHRPPTGGAKLHRRRPIHDRGHRNWRLCTTLAWGRGHHQAGAAGPQPLVRAII